MTAHLETAIARLADVVTAKSERLQEIRAVRGVDGSGNPVLVLLIDSSPLILHIGPPTTVTVGADTITAPTLTT